MLSRVADGLGLSADMFKEHAEVAPLRGRRKKNAFSSSCVIVFDIYIPYHSHRLTPAPLFCNAAAEGMKLVREVGEALEAKKEKEKEKEAGAKDGPADKKPAKSEGAGASAEQQYVRSVIQLHDKYLDYVTGCFNNSSLFHKALKEVRDGQTTVNVGDCSACAIGCALAASRATSTTARLHKALKDVRPRWCDGITTLPAALCMRFSLCASTQWPTAAVLSQ